MEEPIGNEDLELNDTKDKRDTNNNDIAMETEPKTETTEAAKPKEEESEETSTETTTAIKEEVDSEQTEEYTPSNEDENSPESSNLPERPPIVTQQIPGKVSFSFLSLA